MVQMIELNSFRHVDLKLTLIGLAIVFAVIAIIELISAVRRRKCTEIAVGRAYEVIADHSPHAYGFRLLYEFAADGTMCYGEHQMTSKQKQMTNNWYHKPVTVFMIPKTRKTISSACEREEISFLNTRSPVSTRA